MSAAWNLATQSQQLHLAQHTCNGDRAETGTENPSVWLITRKMLDKMQITRHSKWLLFCSSSVRISPSWSVTHTVEKLHCRVHMPDRHLAVR
mmetsp:Transcript_5528/g.14366  ORF Transcript_5528/g.14366 Transcript_5528/m.14366 type:complete len:92 (+) Transcript_5528:645-920(+)